VPGSSNIQKLGDEDDSESDSDKDQFNDLSDLKQANLSPPGGKVLSASNQPKKI
jgi:hypothetical protein